MSTVLRPSGTRETGTAAALLGMALLLALAHLGFRQAAAAGPLALAAAALIYAGVALLIWRARGRAAEAGFGAANAVTLLRAGIAALLGGAAIELLLTGAAPAPAAQWALAGAAFLAWLLDGIDGWLARRLRLASAFGARFDMEVDALFILVLSALLLAERRAGAWVLIAGLLRYLYVAAGALWPALRRPLAPSFRRKATCAAAAGLLVLGTVPGLPPAAAAIALGSSVLALLWSFGIDAFRLLRSPAEGSGSRV